MTSSATPVAAERRHDLDRLRIFAVWILFLFHGLLIFSPAPFFHVRNADHSTLAMIVTGFIDLWHMPLFFLLAGWSAHASLRRRGAGGYLQERWRKLAVPLIAGCVLMAPVIKFLELRGGQDLNHRGLFVAERWQESFRVVAPNGFPVAPEFEESFLAFLPTFFTDVDRFTWSHLWFLVYLLVLSLVFLPAWIGIMGSRAVPTRLSRGWLYLPLGLLLLNEWLLRPHFPGPYNLYRDWANLTEFGIYLFAGFLLARFPALGTTLAGEWRRLLGVGLVAMLALLAAVLTGRIGTVRVEPVVAVAGWCAVLAIVGFAGQHLRHPGPRLAYLVESAFPVYLLHQIALVVIGTGIVMLPLGILPKLVLLLAASILAVLAVYHGLVRSNRVGRLLCGMPTRPSHTMPLSTAAPEGVTS